MRRLLALTFAMVMIPAGMAHAAITYSVNAASRTASITHATVSEGITLSLTIDPKGAGLTDDLLISSLPFTGGGCTAQAPGSKCPLSSGATAMDTINGSFTGSVSDYNITADLDRPGLRMTGSFVGGPASFAFLFSGAPTVVGALSSSGFGTSTGGDDDDGLVGGDGANTIVGGAGSDGLVGLKGNDTLIGGPGDDTLSPGPGTTEIAEGGPGSQDTLSAAGEDGPATYSLDGIVNDGLAGQTLTLSGIENLTGSDGGDALTGDVGFNHIYGGPGNDVINGGGGGHDVLRGGAGDDTVNGRDVAALFSDVSCGGGTDVAIVDAADLVDPDCETVDRAPAPAGSAAPGGGGPSLGGAMVPVAAAAPKLTLTLPRRVRRADLRRGVRIGVGSDQTVAVTAELVTTARGARARTTVPRDNVVLARTTVRGVRARTTIRLKAPASLTRGVRKVALRVTAVNGAGVRTVVRRRLVLRR